MSQADIHLRARAKINLALSVRGRRADGFHELRSWVVFLDWWDELTFRPARDLELHVVGGEGAVPTGVDNLVWRAADALAAAAGRSAGASITLTKRIPSGAGLGGGSSDAAETLRGLNQLWELNWSRERLCTVAAGIGSDVPLFLHDGVVLMEGRGERLSPLSLNWRGWAALIVPSFPLGTADVYRAFTASAANRRELPIAIPDGIQCAAALSELLFNDLESPAFALEDRLRQIHATLDGLNPTRVRMTGSGSALFALFDSQQAATAWRETASRHCPSEVRFHVARIL